MNDMQVARIENAIGRLTAEMKTLNKILKEMLPKEKKESIINSTYDPPKRHWE